MLGTPQEIREKIDKVQALYDGAKTDGERQACRAAMDRLEEALGHYGRQKTGRTKKKKWEDPEDSPQAERLKKEWAREWSATFTPGHQTNASFASALDDFLNDFFDGKPPKADFHQKTASKAAYPKAYDRRK